MSEYIEDLNELIKYNGRKVSCEIAGRSVPEALVIVGGKSVTLYFDGTFVGWEQGAEEYGYTYGWFIDERSNEENGGLIPEVKEIKLLDEDNVIENDDRVIDHSKAQFIYGEYKCLVRDSGTDWKERYLSAILPDGCCLVWMEDENRGDEWSYDAMCPYEEHKPIEPKEPEMIDIEVSIEGVPKTVQITKEEFDRLKSL